MVRQRGGAPDSFKGVSGCTLMRLKSRHCNVALHQGNLPAVINVGVTPTCCRVATVTDSPQGAVNQLPIR